MTDFLKTQKDTMRAEAKRARALLSLNNDDYKKLCTNFFDNIEVNKNVIVSAYYPIDRELDTQILIDKLLDLNVTVTLPIVQKDSRILKFVQYNHDTDLVSGVYGICHPSIENKTQYLLPDIFIVPLLAFDRRGQRLGYGGGYYDATLSHYSDEKDILAIGLAYAEQACLFNLPSVEHDIKMDYIITQQGVHNFKEL